MTAVYSAPNTGVVAQMVPVVRIHASNYNPRRNFDQAALQEMAESIQQHGMIEPIVLRPLPEGEYEIIAGERRWRAAKLAGLAEVPAVIRDVEDREAYEMALVENLVRRDIDPIEEACGYQMLREIGYKQSEIAQKVNREQPTIANRLRLLQLPPSVQQLISDSRLSPSHGVALARFAAFPKVAEQVAQAAIERSLPSKTLANHHTAVGFTPVLREGLAVQFSLREAIFGVKDHCDACPHNACVKSADYAGKSWDTIYCLKPACHKDLMTKAKADIEKRVKAELASAGKSVNKIPNLRELPADGYADLRYGAPGSCTQDCPCRGKAIDWAGAVVDICTDAKRYRACKMVDGKEKGKARKAHFEEQLAQITEALDRGGDQVRRRALALLLQVPVYAAPVEARRAAAKHVKNEQLKAYLEQPGYEFRDSKGWELLATAGTEAELVTAVVDAYLHSQIIQARQSGYDHCQQADWFLANLDADPAPNQTETIPAEPARPDAGFGSIPLTARSDRALDLLCSRSLEQTPDGARPLSAPECLEAALVACCREFGIWREEEVEIPTF